MRMMIMIGLLLVLSAPTLRGETIDYVITGTGSGFIGGTTFSGAHFIITLTADTNIGSGITGTWTIFTAPVSAATLEIGNFPLTNIALIPTLAVFSNQGSQVVGLNRFVGGDLITLSDPAFANYDLDTSIGPIFDPQPGAIFQFTNLATDLGSVTMTQVVDAYFQAFLGGIGGSVEEFLRGDGNGDGSINVADAIAILLGLFGQGSFPILCMDATDVNDDGTGDLADAVYLLSALFNSSASAIPEPSASCGVDPTDTDSLDCAAGPCVP